MRDVAAPTQTRSPSNLRDFSKFPLFQPSIFEVIYSVRRGHQNPFQSTWAHPEHRVALRRESISFRRERCLTLRYAHRAVRVSESEAAFVGVKSSSFETTRWTMVLRAADGDRRGLEALDQLCRSYWLPLYVYVRRRGYTTHDAEDLTQAFLANLLRRGAIGHADPARGRFRSFLLTALANFLHDAWDHDQATRRGGSVERVSFDAAEMADVLNQVEAEALSPDRAFDRGWTLALLDRALRRLRAEQERAGKGRWFERLRPHLQARPDAGDYEAIATEFAVTKNVVAVAVHRLAIRFRELVRAEIAETVNSPEQLQQELRDLLGSLSS